MTSVILQKPFHLAGVILVLFLSATDIFAQCNCKFTIAAGAGYTYFDGAAKGVKPGDVICVSSGSIQTIQFINIQGAAGNPVVIKNCGGQVLLGGATADNGMLFTASRYVHVTGTGASGVMYGFKVTSTASGSQGFAYTGLSSDVEIDHMEIASAGYAGIMAKTDPSSNCADQSAVRPNFTLYNVLIHDNYIHESVGEGIYLGDSFYTGTTVFCGAMEYCHEVRGVRIYNNLFQNTGRESIQVGAGVTDVQIYNNKIYNYGAQNLAEQNGGVQLGLGTAGKFYNNFIKGGTGPAIAVQGIGGDYIYNNVIVNPGQDAITINTRPTPLATDIVNKGYVGGVYIINNTFVNAQTDAVIEYVNGAPGNAMYNNLIVASVTAWDKTYTYTDWKKGNNIAIPVLANAKFLNAAGDDYHLTAGSPAIDAGTSVSSYGVTLDFDNKARPSGKADDAGAFEFVSTSQPPVANAGADQSITLPANTLNLAGSGTDPDGTIASYSWTKQSGPAATLTNATTATLALSALVAGTYDFRLTVTDNSGLTAFDDAIVTVKPAPLPPVVNAGADQTITLPTNTATIAGMATDPDGTIASYAWTKVSGPAATMTNATTATLSVSGLTAGTYDFKLTATDNSGMSTSDDVIITVKAAGVPPVVNAGVDQTVTLPLALVTLTGSATEAGGTISSYAWTKISGPTATLAGITTNILSVTGLVAGTFVFRLTATGNTGLTGSDDVAVTINPVVVINQPPVVNVGADKSITLPTSSLSITATASDPDGTIASYSWTKQSGPAATLAGTNTITLFASALVAGSYDFRLTVTDNSGATAYDDVIVTVNPASVVTAGTVFYRINCGSPAAITDTPMNWAVDSQLAKSPYLSSGSSDYTCGATTWTGTNTTGAPDDLFGPNRYSPNYGDGTPMQWSFPLVAGSYEVHLFFAETPYAGGVKTAGARVFSVQMEGATVLSNYDIYASVGMGAAKKVFQVTVSDGNLNIDFVRITGNPQLNGIEIISSSGSTSRVVADEEPKVAVPEIEFNLDVYPNPFHDKVTLEFASEQKEVAVSVMTLAGVTLHQESQRNTTSLSLDLSDLSMAQGVYILVIQSDEKKVMRRILRQ